mgnify:CR=1 FL=1
MARARARCAWRHRARSRACVALAKVALLHHQHRPTINPTGKLLTATLGLLEAKVPPSVHRWAVEALMFLTVMPDTKEHLVSKGVAFGSLTALAESVGKDSSFHFSLVSAFRRLCVPRKKSDEEKRLEQEEADKLAGRGRRSTLEKLEINLQELDAEGAGALYCIRLYSVCPGVQLSVVPVVLVSA